MTDMVIRIAKAIIGPHLPVPDGVGYTLEHLREIRWRNHSTEAERRQAICSARAVLAELREPTDDMVEVGWGSSPRRCWQQMADAALEPRPC